MKERPIISAAEAARIMGMAPETVRYRMETGEYKIGKIYPPRTKNGRKRYEVSVELLNRHLNGGGNG